MQFNVPQFIEKEAKIVGPLTFKQFIYVGCAGGLIIILYYSVSFFVFLPIATVLGLGALGLALVKINGKSLPEVIANFFNFVSSPRIFLWQKEKTETQKKIDNIEVFEKDSFSFKEELGKESQIKKIGTRIETK